MYAYSSLIQTIERKIAYLNKKYHASNSPIAMQCLYLVYIQVATIYASHTSILYYTEISINFLN